MSEIVYHKDHMLLPAVSQDTLGKWEAAITIMQADENALANDYKVEGQFETLNSATDAALDFGRNLVDTGEHEKKVQENEKWKSKPA